MPNWRIMQLKKEDTCIRDTLARDRTTLSNERTLLAYLRTAIMSLASGITMIKLFKSDIFFQTLGYILIPTSIMIAVLGHVRYTRMRQRIANSNGSKTDK